VLPDHQDLCLLVDSFEFVPKVHSDFRRQEAGSESLLWIFLARPLFDVVHVLFFHVLLLVQILGDHHFQRQNPTRTLDLRENLLCRVQTQVVRQEVVLVAALVVAAVVR
tara:strand:- start:1222 stop:1548 length:327 start_codon:yes stop_codon:yes gene_type:complete